eukprot:GHVL01021861.1.p1 GENE.GHVL01021861.1~~GHVL01021861.1.p1  ORF type:complete len:626 (+),score=88.71 GHVL01021861.1:42-1919(+)
MFFSKKIPARSFRGGIFHRKIVVLNNSFLTRSFCDRPRSVVEIVDIAENSIKSCVPHGYQVKFKESICSDVDSVRLKSFLFGAQRIIGDVEYHSRNPDEGESFIDKLKSNPSIQCALLENEGEILAISSVVFGFSQIPYNPDAEYGIRGDCIPTCWEMHRFSSRKTCIIEVFLNFVPKAYFSCLHTISKSNQSWKNITDSSFVIFDNLLDDARIISGSALLVCFHEAKQYIPDPTVQDSLNVEIDSKEKHSLRKKNVDGSNNKNVLDLEKTDPEEQIKLNSVDGISNIVASNDDFAIDNIVASDDDFAVDTIFVSRRCMTGMHDFGKYTVIMDMMESNFDYIDRISTYKNKKVETSEELDKVYEYLASLPLKASKRWLSGRDYLTYYETPSRNLHETVTNDIEDAQEEEEWLTTNRIGYEVVHTNSLDAQDFIFRMFGSSEEYPMISKTNYIAKHIANLLDSKVRAQYSVYSGTSPNTRFDPEADVSHIFPVCPPHYPPSSNNPHNRRTVHIKRQVEKLTGELHWVDESRCRDGYFALVTESVAGYPSIELSAHVFCADIDKLHTTSWLQPLHRMWLTVSGKYLSREKLGYANLIDPSSKSDFSNNRCEQVCTKKNVIFEFTSDC